MQTLTLSINGHPHELRLMANGRTSLRRPFTGTQWRHWPTPTAFLERMASDIDNLPAAIAAIDKAIVTNQIETYKP